MPATRAWIDAYRARARRRRCRRAADTHQPAAGRRAVVRRAPRVVPRGAAARARARRGRRREGRAQPVPGDDAALARAAPVQRGARRGARPRRSTPDAPRGGHRAPTLEHWGLTGLVLDRARGRYEYRGGPAHGARSRACRRHARRSRRSKREIERQLNAPFSRRRRARAVPLLPRRPARDGAMLGLAYDHFIAGGDCIVALLHAIVARAARRRRRPAAPPELYPPTQRAPLPRAMARTRSRGLGTRACARAQRARAPCARAIATRRRPQRLPAVRAAARRVAPAARRAAQGVGRDAQRRPARAAARSPSPRWCPERSTARAGASRWPSRRS